MVAKQTNKQKQSTGMILLIHLLKYIFMICGLKMKDHLIKQEKVVKKNLEDLPQLEGDKK